MIQMPVASNFPLNLANTLSKISDLTTYRHRLTAIIAPDIHLLCKVVINKETKKKAMLRKQKLSINSNKCYDKNYIRKKNGRQLIVFWFLSFRNYEVKDVMNLKVAIV